MTDEEYKQFTDYLKGKKYDYTTLPVKINLLNLKKVLKTITTQTKYKK